MKACFVTAKPAIQGKVSACLRHRLRLRFHRHASIGAHDVT